MSAGKYLGKFFLLLIVLFFAPGTLAHPAISPGPGVKVVVDGREITFDVPPVIENGRTLVPIRGIAEALGARVSWEEKSKTVTIEKHGVAAKLTVGQKIAFKNTEKILLDAPAKIIQDRTIVPLRFVSEALGASVHWEPVSRLVRINTPPDEKLQRTLVVQGDLVNIRSGPGTDHDVLSQVSRGVTLRTIDRTTDWYKVQLPGGKTGWIVAWYVKEEATSPPAAPPVPEKPASIIPIPVPGPKEKPAENTPGNPDRPGSEKREPGNNDQPSRSGQAEEPPAESKQDSGQNKNHSQEESKGEPNSPVTLPDSKEKENQQTKPEEESPGKNAATIRVTVQEENELTRVKISGAEKLTYNVFRLRAPDRLVVDVTGTCPGELPASQQINTKTISQLRTGWFSRDPDVTRLVFDLKEQVLYKVAASPDQKEITLEIFIPNIKDALRGKTIVLDPGHGGSDPGAIGKMLGLQEKDVNLDVAQRAARLFGNYGARVILTRSGDSYVELDDRAQKANAARADLFISIHMNANSSPQLKGTSTYYVRSAGDAGRLAESRRLAEQIQSALLATLRLEDKDVRQADFVILTKTTMPAVLVEAAFLSNPEEERLIATPQFRENVAQAIVQGTGNYFTSASYR